MIVNDLVTDSPSRARAVITYVCGLPVQASGTSSSRVPFGYDANTGPPLISRVTDLACRVAQRSSTCVGALHTSGGVGPASETICTSDAAGVVVGAGRPVDAGGAAEVAVVTGLAAWLVEHAVSATIAAVADQNATRDRRITRS